MDKYFPLTKPSSARRLASAENQRQRNCLKYHPYSESKPNPQRHQNDLLVAQMPPEKVPSPFIRDGHKPSTKVLNKHLLSTLGDESNPITHSELGLRSDIVNGDTFTGHQMSEGPSVHTGYYQERARKLKEQNTETSPKSTTLRGTRVYINGFLQDTTDNEMKRILFLAGADVLYTASGATHILTSQQLSGSKTHKILTTKMRTKVHVVRPEWVTDSIRAGMRLSERDYSVLRNNATVTLADAFSRTAGRRI